MTKEEEFINQKMDRVERMYKKPKLSKEDQYRIWSKRRAEFLKGNKDGAAKTLKNWKGKDFIPVTDAEWKAAATEQDIDIAGRMNSPEAIKNNAAEWYKRQRVDSYIKDQRGLAKAAGVAYDPNKKLVGSGQMVQSKPEMRIIGKPVQVPNMSLTEDFSTKRLPGMRTIRPTWTQPGQFVPQTISDVAGNVIRTNKPMEGSKTRSLDLAPEVTAMNHVVKTQQTNSKTLQKKARGAYNVEYSTNKEAARKRAYRERLKRMNKEGK